MQSLNWHLDKLLPRQGDSFDTLNDWFDSRSNQYMDECFNQGWRYHKGNLNQFTQTDWRQTQANDDGDRPTHWRQQMAKRLFGLRMAVSIRASHLDKLAKCTFPNRHWLHDHFWRLRNCRPYCGLWSADNLPSNPKNPTGKPCLSRLCPWCWMRRFDDYVKACLTGQGCTAYSVQRRELPGMGFPRLVSAVIFDHVFDADPDDRQAEWDRQPFDLYGTIALRQFNQLRTGPIHPYLFRLTAPIYLEALHEGFVTPAVGLRTGLIHTGRINLDKKALKEEFGAEAAHNVTIQDAIRWVYPYPIDWLESDQFAKVKMTLLGCLHGLTHHGIRKVYQPRGINSAPALH